MSNEKHDQMVRHVGAAFESLRRLVNLGIGTYAFFIFASINGSRLLNKQSEDLQIDMLGIKAHQHYYSLMFALLYLVFMILLYFRFDLLSVTLRKYRGIFDPKQDSQLLTRYPWLASPFYEGRRTPVAFYLVLTIALVNCAWLAFAHLLGIGAPGAEVIDPWVYQFVIGSACLLATLAGLVCLRLIVQCIRSIRETLAYE